MVPIHHHIGGKAVSGTSGRTGPVFDPARGVQTHEVDYASVEEVDQAIAVAVGAGESWGAMSLARRSQILFAIRDILDSHRADIARAITEQHGKVFSDAMGEVARGLENVDFACGI